MKINSNDIKNMVSECLNKLLLNEAIRMEDAYNRYYSQIQKDVWDELTKGTVNMTPFHKKVADFILKSTNPMGLAILASQCWNMSKTAQQFLVNTAKEGYGYYDTEQYLKGFLQSIIANELRSGHKKFSENEFLDGGLVKICEDENTIVTCTVSYTASAKYFGKTHWCTASGIEGRWDGFKMFKNYTVEESGEYGETPILIQVCDKHNPEHAFQIQVKADSIGQICNFMDEGETIGTVKKEFGDIVSQALNSIPFKKLSKLTADYVESESHYYSFKSERYMAKAKNFVATSLASDNCKQAALAYMKKALNDAMSIEVSDGHYTPLFYFWIMGQKQTTFSMLLDFEEIDDGRADKFNVFTDADRNYIFRASQDSCILTRVAAIVEVTDTENGFELNLKAWFPCTTITNTEEGFLALMNVDTKGNSTILIADNKTGEVFDKFPDCSLMPPSIRTSGIVGNRDLYIIGRHTAYREYEMFGFVDADTGKITRKHQTLTLTVTNVWVVKDFEGEAPIEIGR